jgi:hypothetical protein
MKLASLEGARVIAPDDAETLQARMSEATTPPDSTLRPILLNVFSDDYVADSLKRNRPRSRPQH